MIANAFVAAFCTALVAIGWYYLARSPGVVALEPYESPRRNRTRRKARRMGAWAIIVAAFAGFWLTMEFKWRTSPLRILLTFVLLTLALVAMVISVIVDTYLTHRMRQGGPRPPKH